MNIGSEYVNEDLFGLEDEDIGEEINSRTNVTNISSGDMVVQNRRSGKMNQTTINDAYKKEARERACMLITRWMYEAAIPFNVVTYPSFQPMIEAIGQYGVGMKDQLFMRLLELKRPHLYWTPCAAHCLDLMLEDIGKLPNIKRTLERAISLNGYIYNRSRLLNMMRRFTGQRELLRLAPMGYIYETMNRAKDTIVRSFNGNEEKYKQIFNIIDKRWRFTSSAFACSSKKKLWRSEFVHKCSRTIRNELMLGQERLEHRLLQICKVYNESPQLNMRASSYFGAEEARFDTRARARARASSSIIPPTRG
ncbi:hypothetical protein AAG906_007371 [Vitis piasezkii]